MKRDAIICCIFFYLDDLTAVRWNFDLNPTPTRTSTFIQVSFFSDVGTIFSSSTLGWGLRRTPHGMCVHGLPCCDECPLRGFRLQYGLGRRTCFPVLGRVHARQLRCGCGLEQGLTALFLFQMQIDPDFSAPRKTRSKMPNAI